MTHLSSQLLNDGTNEGIQSELMERFHCQQNPKLTRASFMSINSFILRKTKTYNIYQNIIQMLSSELQSYKESFASSNCLQQNNTSRSGYLDISWRRILLPMEPPAWSWRMAAMPGAMTMWSSHDITWPIKECPMTGLVVAVLTHPNLDWATEFRTAMVSKNLYLWPSS